MQLAHDVVAPHKQRPLDGVADDVGVLYGLGEVDFTDGGGDVEQGIAPGFGNFDDEGSLGFGQVVGMVNDVLHLAQGAGGGEGAGGARGAGLGGFGVGDDVAKAVDGGPGLGAEGAIGGEIGQLDGGNLLGGFGSIEEGEEASEAVHFFAVANIADESESLSSFYGLSFIKI